MLFGKFRILGKLALLVLVPLIGVVALSVPIVINRVEAARTAQETADAVEIAAAVGTALQELQEERLLSVGYLFTLTQQPELVVQTAKAKDRIARLNDLDLPMSSALKQALGFASGLERTRAAVLSRQARPDLIVSEFTEAITRIIYAMALSREADLTTATGRQIFALEQAIRSDDMISQSSSYLISAVATQQQGFVGLFSAKLVELQLVVIRSEPFFTRQQYQLYLLAQQAFVARTGPNFFVEVATNPTGAIKNLNVLSLYSSLRSVLVLGGFLQKRISADVDAAVTKSRTDATRQAYVVGGAALLLLIIVFGLSMLMARAVARPLRRLTVSADRIARAAESELERVADDEAESVRPIRLDPVDVQARDEIGDLARAFDRVQTTAARLVERQVVGRRNVAQMFGHVGRRTQNLVGRQLALIDSLERRETDSDRLRELYRLDHMSSRLRRNASSLVVLSGGAGANDHMAPLPLSDVVRLALGEIEDYTRVDVEVPEEITVLPAVVADLTLVLAELMENATSFSPPHTRVTVVACELRAGVRLSIIDHGLGLSPERLAEENARLTTRERLDLAPSEVLGLFVVGRLARRHGLEVSLTDTPDGGLTAHVDLRPVHLLARAESMVPVGAQPIRATVPSSHTEFAPLIAGGGARSAPGSAQPFDAQVLNRATRTLEAGRSWNAFAPIRSSAPALEAGPSVYQAQPLHHGEPVHGGRQPSDAQPVSEAQTYERAANDQPHPYEPHPYEGEQSWDRRSADMPVTSPADGPYAGTEPPIVMEGPIVMSAPAAAIELPRQRTPDNHGGLRRRVPGSQLPIETGPKLPATPPTTDDAMAARDQLEAFEAGVSRAQWDVIEADMAAPPAAGHAPLARRVPGATLPVGSEKGPTPPPPPPAKPMDPDEARAQMEQFEYGVALALNEVRPQHEGQPR